MFWSNRPRSKLWHGALQKRGKSCPQVHSDSRLSSIKQIWRQCLSQPVLNLRMLVCPAFGLSHTVQRENNIFKRRHICFRCAFVCVTGEKRVSLSTESACFTGEKQRLSCIGKNVLHSESFSNLFSLGKRGGERGGPPLGWIRRFMKAPKPENERKSGWASFRLAGYQLWSR